MERREQAGLAVDCGARRVRAASSELRRGHAAPRREAGVEEHLAAARRGPFVVACGRVRAERERRAGLLRV